MLSNDETAAQDEETAAQDEETAAQDEQTAQDEETAAQDDETVRDGETAAQDGEKLIASRKHKTGVVYISRIPPHMTVSILRAHFSAFGEVGRIYLRPEKPIAKTVDESNSSRKAPKYIDGWIEFIQKSVAKKVGLICNNMPIGGKKRHNRWRDDILTIKYLKGFKFGDIRIQKRHEKMKRDQELRSMMSVKIGENRHFANQIKELYRHEAVKKAIMDKKGRKKLYDDLCSNISSL